MEKIESASNLFPRLFSLWLRKRIIETARPIIPVNIMKMKGPINPLMIIQLFKKGILFNLYPKILFKICSFLVKNVSTRVFREFEQSIDEI